MGIHEWIEEHIKRTSQEIVILVRSSPDSFNCGYQMGVKQTLIDLQDFLELQDTE